MLDITTFLAKPQSVAIFKDVLYVTDGGISGDGKTQHCIWKIKLTLAGNSIDNISLLAGSPDPSYLDSHCSHAKFKRNLNNNCLHEIQPQPLNNNFKRALIMPKKTMTESHLFFKLGKHPAKQDVRNIKFKAILKKAMPTPVQWDFDSDIAKKPIPPITWEYLTTYADELYAIVDNKDRFIKSSLVDIKKLDEILNAIK